MNDGVEWGNVAQWAMPALSLCVTICLATWAVWRGSNKEAYDGLTKKIDEVRGDIAALRVDDGRAFSRIDDAERIIGKLEVEMAHRPTRAEIHQLDIKVTDLRAEVMTQFATLVGKVDVIAARVEPIKAISERIQESMLEGRP